MSRMKRIMFILAFLVLVVILVLVFFLKSNTGGPAMPTPTPTENQGTGAAPGVPFSVQTQRANDRAFMVAGLLDKLPYVGTNSSLYYSYSNDLFTLYLNPGNQTAGNSEFDAFLQKNGVADRSWIQNLTTTTVKITPAP